MATTPDMLVYALHQVAIAASPDPETEHAFTRMTYQMRMDSIPEANIAIALSGAIHDGLCKGNWPTISGSDSLDYISYHKGH